MEEPFLWLPESIMHRILSYLNAKEQAQVSVLSKDWLAAWRTNPKLDFNDRYFRKKTIANTMELGKFQEYVNDTLQRYKDCNIDEFNLCMTLTVDDFATTLNNWLGIALEKSVKVLQLTLHEGSSSSYVLPVINILKDESLTKLCLTRCKIPQSLDGIIMCKNIRALHLFSVYDMNDEMFGCLISACPLIDELKVSDYDELNNIKVVNLCSLKQLYIAEGYGSETRSIEVDAQSLQTMELRLLYGQCALKFHSCQNLKSLSIHSALIKGRFFETLTDKFPNLEYLEITSCYGFKKINLRSHSLKHLCLYSSSENLVDVEIDAPCMVMFEFLDVMIPNISFTRASKQLKSRISTVQGREKF